MNMSILMSIGISFAAVIIAALSLYFNSLKGVDLNTKIEVIVKDIEKNKKELPDDLSFNIYMCTFNNGNSPGIVRNIQVQFSPEHGFEKFISQVLLPVFREYIDISVKGTKYESGIVRILLKNVNRDIKELLSENIENDTLLPLLNDMKKKKIEYIKEFLNFLKKNKTLGELKITWEYTYSPWISSIKFKKKTETVPVNHSYKNLLEVCDYWMHNFEFKPSKDKIIDGIIKNLGSLRGLYKRNLEEYRRHYRNQLLGASLEIINEKFNEKFQETFILLEKCKKYRDKIKIIERPYERVRAFLDYVEKYTGNYPKDEKQKIKEVETMLKDFKEETQKAIENIDSLIELIKAENNSLSNR